MPFDMEKMPAPTEDDGGEDEASQMRVLAAIEELMSALEAKGLMPAPAAPEAPEVSEAPEAPGVPEASDEGEVPHAEPMDEAVKEGEAAGEGEDASALAKLRSMAAKG